MKFWPFMSFSDIVLLLPYTIFVASSLYFTVVFNSTKLSSIPSLRVLFPADAFKHSFPSSSRSLSSSYVTHSSVTRDGNITPVHWISLSIYWGADDRVTVHCMGCDSFLQSA